jgi:hypothetical protein
MITTTQASASQNTTHAWRRSVHHRSLPNAFNQACERSTNLRPTWIAAGTSRVAASSPSSRRLAGAAMTPSGIPAPSTARERLAPGGRGVGNPGFSAAWLPYFHPPTAPTSYPYHDDVKVRGWYQGRPGAPVTERGRPTPISAPP